MAAKKTESLYDKTIRWTFADGPTAGMTFEHIFHKDGSVDWKSLKGEKTREKHAAATKVAEGVFAVSYLGAKGYTLTTILDFHSMKMVGFASNEKQWSQQKGTFEIVA
jgi:hypothetical protein